MMKIKQLSDEVQEITEKLINMPLMAQFLWLHVTVSSSDKTTQLAQGASTHTVLEKKSSAI